MSEYDDRETMRRDFEREVYAQNSSDDEPVATQAGSPTRPDGQVGSTIDPSLPPAPAAGPTIYAARDEHVDALRGPLDAQPNYDPVAAIAYAKEMGLPTEFDPAAESGEVTLPWGKRVLETGRLVPDAQTPKNLAALLDHQNKIIADLRRQITSPSYDSVHSNMVHYQAKCDDLQRQLENRSECEVCDRTLGRDDNCVCLACWNKVNAEFAGERAAKRLPSDLEAIVHSHLVDDRGDDRYPPDLCNFVAHLADQLAAERAAREAAERAYEIRELLELRAQLAQAEPVAWMYDVANDGLNDCTQSKLTVNEWPDKSKIVPLYTAPPCAERDRLPAAPESEGGKP